MRLHPDAAAILERVREAGVPPWRLVSPVEGREVYRRRALLFQDDPLPVGEVADTTIPSGHGPPRHPHLPTRRRRAAADLHLSPRWWLDARRPRHPRRRLPPDLGRGRLPGRRGSTTGWRPKTRYPAAMDDTVAAVRWLADHGAELGGDPTRLALGGDSAGGNLTAGAVIRLRDEGGPRVAAPGPHLPGHPGRTSRCCRTTRTPRATGC